MSIYKTVSGVLKAFVPGYGECVITLKLCVLNNKYLPLIVFMGQEFRQDTVRIAYLCSTGSGRRLRGWIPESSKDLFIQYLAVGVDCQLRA